MNEDRNMDTVLRMWESLGVEDSLDAIRRTLKTRKQELEEPVAVPVSPDVKGTGEELVF